MAASGFDWGDSRFRDAIDASFKTTAKCRGAFKSISQSHGAKTVTVSKIRFGRSVAIDSDEVESALRISVDVKVQEHQHAGDLPTVIKLISLAAGTLGELEDKAIVEGVPNAALPTGNIERCQNGAGINFGCLMRVRAVDTTTVAAAKRRKVVRAVSDAIAKLENANRPGTYSLILQNKLLSALNLPAVAGGSPPVNRISALIGGSHIVGTTALSNAANAGDVCGILFRLDPAAVELVQTQPRTIYERGKTAGVTVLRIEEAIAVKILDPTAVHHLVY